MLHKYNYHIVSIMFCYLLPNDYIVFDSNIIEIKQSQSIVEVFYENIESLGSRVFIMEWNCLISIHFLHIYLFIINYIPIVRERMSRSRSKQKRSTKFEVEVSHETLYPILVNASERNKELFFRTFDNSNQTQEKDNHDQSNNYLLKNSTSQRKSLSPFRWTIKNFMLPQLQQKNKNYLSRKKAGRYMEAINKNTEEKKVQELEVIKEGRRLFTSRAQIRNQKKSFKKYYPNFTYRESQEQPNMVTPNTVRVQQSTIELKNSGFMFIMKSKDSFIRKALQSIGWMQNKNRKSPFFQLKWTNTDTPIDYYTLKEGQYYNHIKNTDYITNKGKLSRNIYKVAGFEFYPRTYNLQNQYYQFLQDFNNTGVSCLLKKYVGYIQSKVPFLYDNPKKVQLGHVLKLNIFTSRDYHFTLNIALVVSLILYLEKMRKNMNIIYFQYEQGYIDVDINVDMKMVDMLLSYSRIGVVQRATQKIQDKNLQTHIYSGKYEIPSEEILSLLIIYYKLFKRKLNYFESDGMQNIWIVKPINASSEQEMEFLNRVDNNTTKKIKNRIAQKYVENCMLLKEIPKQQFMWKYIQGKKFDVRQWILLTSSPRRIYKFSSSYMRFCSNPYSLANLNDKKHSTINHNQSTNKGNIQPNDVEWSILSTEQLFSYLKTIKEQNIEEDFNRQVDKIVVQTISNNFNKFDLKKNCFELFGFDFLMDENYKLWLMEVNSLPASEEKSIWLKEMLFEMGLGLLKIVLPESYTKGIGVNESPNYKSKLQQQYHWKIIYGEGSNNIIYQTPQVNAKGNLNISSKVFMEYAVEGSLMKEIHKKVQAQKLLNNLFLNYAETNRKQVVHFLKKLKPIKQHSVYNFMNISMLNKILEIIIHRTMKSAMKSIKLEYFEEVEDSEEEEDIQPDHSNGKPDSRQISQYLDKYYYSKEQQQQQ